MMLAFDPLSRPSLAEIKTHPWYNGELPTEEEIIQEFDQRKAALAQANNQPEAPIPTDTAGPNAYTQHTVHRGIGDTVEESKVETVERKEAPYTPQLKRITQFFSTSKLEDLFEALVTYASKTTSDFQIDSKTYTVDISVLVEANDGENSETKNQEMEKVKMMVSILKVPDQDKHCVEAVLVEGDRFKFNKLYQRMRAYFGGHSNANETD